MLKIAEDRPLTAQDVRYAVQLVAVGKNSQLVRLNGDVAELLPEARKSHPRHWGKTYIDAMRQILLFLVSDRQAPVRLTWPWPWRWLPLRNKEVERIILTRPAVEAGERLGFLPGTCRKS